MKNNVRLTILKVLTVFLALAGGADAGESVPISVQVSIEVNALKSSWTSMETEKVIADATHLVTTSLKKKHPHWDFRSDGKDRTCSVRLRVVDPEPDDGKHEAEIKLEVTPGDADDHWPSHKWLTPVDFQFRRFPKVHSMAENLAAILEDRFLSNRSVPFRIWLQETIPLARKGEWREKDTLHSNFQIVLSLPYEAFSALKASLFQIKGKPADGPVEKLRALGISAPDDYPPRPGEGQYQGLVVQARSIEGDGQTMEIGPQVLGFTLGPVYLLKEMTPRDQELALFEEDGS